MWALLSSWRRFRETQQRIIGEDALKHLHSCQLRSHPATTDSLAGALGRSHRATIRLIMRMEARGCLRSSADGLFLTMQGTLLAIQVIRAHRLWERYLVDEARMSLAAVHAEAERREHDHSREELDALDAAMGHPAVDPHGDPIPDAAGKLAKIVARPIAEMPALQKATIVHLEDEPPAVFARIAAEGFRPGQTVWVVDSDPNRIVLADAEKEYNIAPIVAANIFVTASEEPASHGPIRRLTSLGPGDCATVRGLDYTLQGLTRRRLLDLGITPGTSITSEITAVFRDPIAYRVRNSLIALRHDQAECVLIDSNGNGATSHV